MAMEEDLTEKLARIRSRSQDVREEVRVQVRGYIIAALGFVVGLAWNDAIRALIRYLFPLEQNSLLAQFIYAIGLTIVVVMISVYVVKSTKLDSEE
jgi:hypothetical protein